MPGVNIKDSAVWVMEEDLKLLLLSAKEYMLFPIPPPTHDTGD